MGKNVNFRQVTWVMGHFALMHRPYDAWKI